MDNIILLVSLILCIICDAREKMSACWQLKKCAGYYTYFKDHMLCYKMTQKCWSYFAYLQSCDFLCPLL